MKIDFNNVRREALDAYIDLVETLNSHTDETGRITLEQHEIQEIIDDLRSALVAIGLACEEGNDEFQDVLKDVVVPWLCNEEEAEFSAEEGDDFS